jgi:hypothetical protein
MFDFLSTPFMPELPVAMTAFFFEETRHQVVHLFFLPQRSLL